MKCRRCKDKGISSKAIIFLPHHNLSLCKNCFGEWYEYRLRQTIKKTRMFTPGEKILVAVSGGKDSLALWYALKKLGYKVDAVHIDLGIKEKDYSLISREKAENLGKRIKSHLHIVSIKEHLGEGIPELHWLSGRSPCSVCGLVKRYFINLIAKKGSYSCVATGHNLDDEVATLFSNLLSWDVDLMIRQAPVLPEKKGFARRVKPLVRFTEKENLLYCLIHEIDYIREECPLARGTSSLLYKRLFNEVEQTSPGSKLRFYFNFQTNLRPLLPNKSTARLKSCPSCGQPTTSDNLCAFCRLKERVRSVEAQKKQKQLD